MNSLELDTCGQLCPFPLIEAKKAMETLNKGDLLTIRYDCAQATESIPRWTAEAGHEVTDFEQIGDAQWRMIIKKG